MARTTVTKTISLEEATLKKGMRLAKKRGFKRSFSAYIAKRIEEDDRALAQATATNGKAVAA